MNLTEFAAYAVQQLATRPTAYALHLSLALSARRDANVFSAAAREDAWFLNQDQIDMYRDAAADSRRDARAHLAAAARAKLRADFRAHGMMLDRSAEDMPEDSA